MLLMQVCRSLHLCDNTSPVILKERAFDIGNCTDPAEVGSRLPQGYVIARASCCLCLCYSMETVSSRELNASVVAFV